jgi:hypothetical protein
MKGAQRESAVGVQNELCRNLKIKFFNFFEPFLFKLA